MTTRGSEMTKKLSTDLPKLKRNYGILKIQQENATALYIIAFLILIMVFFNPILMGFRSKEYPFGI